MKISPARTAAFDILLRIETERAYSSVLLPLFECDLSPADGSLCHELVLGVLRRQMFLDKHIDTFSAGKKLDIEVRLALRLALYQLYYLDKVPAYSALNESVNLVQRTKKKSAKGFVNAVLRRATKERVELSYTDETEQISIESSHPRWLIEKWKDEFGINETVNIAASNNEHPQTAFRLLGHRDTDRFAETSARSSNVDGCYLADKADHHVFELAEKGDIYIQDEASQMAACSVEIPAGGRFLDVCAAPGGKTGLIAKRFGSSAALIAAGDLHSRRVEFLRDNCRRQGVDGVNVVQFDAEMELPFADSSFDAVLVDAPCSGTGTIRRNPEIRYFLKPEDFGVLPQKQLSILLNASKLVRSGGSLVYSTCSLEREENEVVCERFLSANADFSIVKPAVPEKFHAGEGFARTWPQRDGMDGFFISAFGKI